MLQRAVSPPSLTQHERHERGVTQPVMADGVKAEEDNQAKCIMIKRKKKTLIITTVVMKWYMTCGLKKKKLI